MQGIIVLLIVGLAAFFLGRRLYRSAVGKKTSALCDKCGEAGGKHEH